jgi:peroxiredoxin
MAHQLIGAAAPKLDVSAWLNTQAPLSLADLRGRVVVLHSFQMLCPGCVLHGTPLAQRIHDRLGGDDLVVIGLHTVFEHHDAMGPVSLQAYLHEFKITMPIAIDRHVPGVETPATMMAYAMRGTPSLVLIDREGNVHQHLFGAVDEVMLGVEIGMLLSEPRPPVAADSCDAGGCMPKNA